MFSGVPNGLLRLSPPQVHAAVHNSGVKQVDNDEQLREQVISAKRDKTEDSLAKVVEIGSEAGFSFTAEELQEVTSELSDEQLDEAAGGMSKSGPWWKRGGGMTQIDPPSLELDCGPDDLHIDSVVEDLDGIVDLA